MSRSEGKRHIPSEQHEPARRDRIGWPRRSDLSRQQPEPSSLYAFVLDADDDLSQVFDLRMRLAARQSATARVLDASGGACDLDPWLAAARDGPGILILEGLLALDTRVDDRTATELLGAGDLLQPVPDGDDMIGHQRSWRALWPTRLALLDGEFSKRVQPWPQIWHALLRRMGRRARDINALRAITSQPRLEVRLDLLLWHLAARWGRVEPAGIRLCLPLTHRLLGQLIGAERPSVSHALSRLTAMGLVTGTTGDLHLHGAVEQHLDALTHRQGTISERRAGAAQRRRMAER